MTGIIFDGIDLSTIENERLPEKAQPIHTVCPTFEGQSLEDKLKDMEISEIKEYLTQQKKSLKDYVNEYCASLDAFNNIIKYDPSLEQYKKKYEKGAK